MTGEGRELRFTLSDFRRIRELVQQQTGIALNDTKAHMAYARLGKRVRALGLRRFAEYLDRLVQQPDGDEWQHFINALTTNLTSFFREPHHFDLLREHAGRHRPPRTYRVWSAATASGEEAYSIAMTLQEALGGEAGQRFEVWASDIDTQVLQQATNAIYPLERTEKLPAATLKRHFDKGIGKQRGKVRIKPALRERVAFYHLNLVAPDWPGLGTFDVIFCRNVLIYFDKPTQAAILTHLADHLQDDGLLLLGHSENILHLTDAFVPCGRTAYRLAPRSS